MSSDSQDVFAVRSAAILDEGLERGQADALLARMACVQRRAGRQVRGLVMIRTEGAVGCTGDMVLIDVHTLDEYLVSQPLGRGATGCRADPQGFARASQVLRDAALQAPDLVICNRFGGLEAQGAGFTQELLTLMAAGLPLLTVVAPQHLAAWERFSGGTAMLAADAQAIEGWIEQALAAPEAS